MTATVVNAKRQFTTANVIVNVNAQQRQTSHATLPAATATTAMATPTAKATATATWQWQHVACQGWLRNMRGPMQGRNEKYKQINLL